VLPPCELEPPLLPELPLDEPPLPPLEPDPEPLLVQLSQPELEPDADPPELALPDEPEPVEEPPNSPDTPLEGDPDPEHALVTAASATRRQPETPYLSFECIVPSSFERRECSRPYPRSGSTLAHTIRRGAPHRHAIR
jgi:hypothetical protein